MKPTLDPVSPAHAGMYPGRSTGSAGRAVFPFPPHTRGCTDEFTKPTSGALEEVSPAHAGMYPSALAPFMVRGLVEFPPHTRGCTLRTAGLQHEQGSSFPPHTRGCTVFEDTRHGYAPPGSFPRTRGDVPYTMILPANGLPGAFPPHTRGCTPGIGYGPEPLPSASCFPRTRGDVPSASWNCSTVNSGPPSAASRPRSFP